MGKQLTTKEQDRVRTLVGRQKKTGAEVARILARERKARREPPVEARQAHTWLGIPSVTISAVLAKDRIIMWQVQEGSWNGEKAAETYKGPMLKSLRRVWGERRQYNIVEDGDRKGNQSNKGIAAKKAAHIKSTMLPPRTPSWMLLDYAVWQRIMTKVLVTAPAEEETKQAFLRRLKKCAMSLPKKWVAMQIGRMKENIKGMTNAKGYHAKND
jgi:hypothetical protein